MNGVKWSLSRSFPIGNPRRIVHFSEFQRVDRPALRSTFISWLSMSKASPRTAQMLAGHTDIRLTMKSYTDPRLLGGRSAVEALPALRGEQVAAEAQATGTAGKKSHPNSVVLEPRVTAHFGRSQCASGVNPTLRQSVAGTRLSASVDSDAQAAPNGGGGNRTRVPEHFRIGLYVRSRSFIVIPGAADRQAVRGTSSTKFSSRGGRAARCDQPAAYRRPA